MFPNIIHNHLHYAMFLFLFLKIVKMTTIIERQSHIWMILGWTRAVLAHYPWTLIIILGQTNPPIHSRNVCLCTPSSPNAMLPPWFHARHLPRFPSPYPPFALVVSPPLFPHLFLALFCHMFVLTKKLLYVAFFLWIGFCISRKNSEEQWGYDLISTTLSVVYKMQILINKMNIFLQNLSCLNVYILLN